VAVEDRVGEQNEVGLAGLLVKQRAGRPGVREKSDEGKRRRDREINGTVGKVP
jgi:hypothetical protein